jgi:teichoic acid transport system ATP-binding protein
MTDTAASPATTAAATAAAGGAEREPAVIVENISVHFDLYERSETDGLLGQFGLRRRRKRRVVAVEDVSFTVRQGERVGLIGTNGAGKTTTLSAVAGLVPVSRGSILTSARPVFLGVGAALQGRLTGRENIRVGLIALGASRREAIDLSQGIIDFTGLRDRIDLPVRTYSSGMKARLQFSIAIATDPKILIVDETLAVGDATFRKRSTRAIRHKLATTSTLFFVSHNNNHVARLCERLLWLEDGRLRMDGPSNEVIAAYEESLREDGDDEDDDLDTPLPKP